MMLKSEQGQSPGFVVAIRKFGFNVSAKETMEEAQVRECHDRI